MTDRPSPETLRLLLDYQPTTGKLFWRERTPDMFEDGAYGAERKCAMFNGQFAGQEAFTSTARGYKVGKVQGHACSAHCVIWALEHGYWPKEEIDHEDNDKTNNRLSNLREATRSQNMWNNGVQANNTSGFKGVSRHGDRWVARIRCGPRYGRKKRHLGRFATPEEAYAAYCAAAQDLHGEFANDET